MKLSKHLRRALLAAAAALLLIGTAAAASAATKKTIEASYMDIKLVIDGVEVTPKDANGNVVEPFMSGGTTYLPVRAVAEALGKEVGWDGDTKTVYIGKVPGAEENWMTKLPPYQLFQATAYDGTDREKFFEVAGTKQTLGVVFKKTTYDRNRPFAMWNLNGEYETMTVTVGHMGDEVSNARVEVYLDGEYSAEYPVTWDGAPKTFTIPVKFAPNVKLQVVYGETGLDGLDAYGGSAEYVSSGTYGIYDISFS